MAHSQADILRLLAHVYVAGRGEGEWTTTLGSLAALFGGAVISDLERGRIGRIRTQGLEQGRDDYIEGGNSINPRAHPALTQSECAVTHDDENLPDDAIRHHEFHDWLERACGASSFIGSRMIDAGDVPSLVSVEFAPRRGHATPEEVRLFELLTPHLADAWRMSLALANATALTKLAEALHEQMPWGVIGLDHRGNVASMNGRASTLLTRADGLTVVKGCLRAHRSAEDRTLQLIIANTLRVACGESIHPGGTLAIPRRNGRPAYAVRIIPTRHTGEATPNGVPVVLVVVSDPDLPSMPRREDLETYFRLTERESELTLLLAAGLSLNAAADQLGIARNTARNHLSNIQRKTGTRGQVSLIRLVNGLPNQHRP
jgi:DNA-binding CsgD family transcriptional regulator